MITELQRWKLVRRFALLDTDGDGFMGKPEYQRIVDQLTRTLGRGAPSARRLLHEVYVGTWNRLERSMDADQDGLVSLDEFVYSVALTVTGPCGNFRSNIAPMLEAVLALSDTDGTGRLSRADFYTWFGAYGVRGHELNASFKHLDQDRKGYLAHAEMRTFTEEYYCSADPQARGNWLLGPLRGLSNPFGRMPLPAVRIMSQPASPARLAT